MSTLPHVSGLKVVQALLKVGYEKDRQKGSHILMQRKSTEGMVTIPILK